MSKHAIAKRLLPFSSGVLFWQWLFFRCVKELLCAALQAEQEEKLRMVQFYNDRLTERERRRDFLRARDLLNMRRMQARTTFRKQPRDGCPQHTVSDLALISWE